MNRGGFTAMRDGRLDVIKGIMICLVVWGHLPRLGMCKDGLETVVWWIYQFHMPIFVLITGYLFGKREGTAHELVVVLGRMLKPYFFAAILSVSLYSVASRIGFSTSAVVTSTDFMGGCWRVLSGRGGGALWYLYTYGVVELLCVCAMLMANQFDGLKECKPWLVLVVVVSGVCLARLCGLSVGKIELLAYFFVGFFARQMKQPLVGSYWFFVPILGFVLANGLLVGKLVNACRFGFVISVFCFLLSVSEWLMGRFKRIGSLISFIGCHTLTLLIFHNMIAVAFRPLSYRVLKYEGSGILLNVMLLVFVVAGCLIAEFVIKKTVLRKLFYSP